MSILRSSDNKILRTQSGELLYVDKYSGAFIFTVAVTAGLVFTLPLSSGAYTHDFWCDWGDGSESYVNAYNSPNASHTFVSAGTYTLRLGGKCQTFSVNNGPMQTYITKVLQWGYCDFRKFDLFGSYITEVPITAITGMNNITNFANFMRNTNQYTGKLSDQWFTQTPLVNNFQYAFSGTNATGDIPEQMYYSCPLVVNFGALYNGSSRLGTGVGATGVMPEKHFWNNPLVEDFSWVWAGTSGIRSGLNANQFLKNTKVKYFGGAFASSGLSGSFPEDIFWNNPDVLSFQQLFENARGFTGTIPEKLFRYNTKVTNMSYMFYFGGSVGASFSGDIPRDLFYYNTEVTTFECLFRWNFSNLNIPNGLFRNNLKATNFYLTFYRMAYATMGQYPFSGIDPLIPGDTEVAAAYRRFTGKSPSFTDCFYIDQYYRGANTRYAPELWDNAIYNMVGNTHSVNTFKSPANVYSNQASIPVGWK